MSPSLCASYASARLFTQRCLATLSAALEAPAAVDRGTNGEDAVGRANRVACFAHLAISISGTCRMWRPSVLAVCVRSFLGPVLIRQTGARHPPWLRVAVER